MRNSHASARSCERINTTTCFYVWHQTRIMLFIHPYNEQLGVVHMRKKFFYSLIAIILLSIIMIVFVKNGKEPSNPLQAAFQDESFPKEEDIDEENDDDDDEQKDASEDKPSLTNRLSNKVQTAVASIFNKEVNIVAIGDSLTQGVGDKNDQGGYVGILERTMDNNEHDLVIEFSNYGKRGNRTDQMLKRLEDEEIQTDIEDANIVLITIGANDIMEVVKENFTNITLDLFTEERNHFEDRLRTIISTIHDLNEDADIYLLGIYNPFEKYFEDIEELNIIVDEWNRTGKLITNEFEQATFIPIKDIFDDATTNLFSEDNFHPNVIGYHRMAERVFEYLTDEEEG